MYTRLCLLFLLIVFLATGCAAQSPAVKDSVFFATLEDYKFGPKGGVDLVWSTQRISDAETLKANLHGYDSLMLEQIWLMVDRKSAHKLDNEQVLATCRGMVNEIKVRLGHDYKLVERPTENTLLVSIALANVETPLPILAATNRFLPDASGSPSLSTIIVGEGAKASDLKVELLVRDAKTREPLVAVIDANVGESNLVTLINAGESRKEQISAWADRLWTTLSYWNWIRGRTPEA